MAVVAEPALSDSRMGVSPATIQAIAAGTAASTENGFDRGWRGCCCRGALCQTPNAVGAWHKHRYNVRSTSPQSAISATSTVFPRSDSTVQRFNDVTAAKPFVSIGVHSWLNKR